MYVITMKIGGFRMRSFESFTSLADAAWRYFQMSGTTRSDRLTVTYPDGAELIPAERDEFEMILASL